MVGFSADSIASPVLPHCVKGSCVPVPSRKPDRLDHRFSWIPEGGQLPQRMIQYSPSVFLSGSLQCISPRSAKPDCLGLLSGCDLNCSELMALV